MSGRRRHVKGPRHGSGVASPGPSPRDVETVAGPSRQSRGGPPRRAKERTEPARLTVKRAAAESGGDFESPVERRRLTYPDADIIPVDPNAFLQGGSGGWPRSTRGSGDRTTRRAAEKARRVSDLMNAGRPGTPPRGGAMASDGTYASPVLIGLRALWPASAARRRRRRPRGEPRGVGAVRASGSGYVYDHGRAVGRATVAAVRDMLVEACWGSTTRGRRNWRGRSAYVPAPAAGFEASGVSKATTPTPLQTGAGEEYEPQDGFG